MRTILTFTTIFSYVSASVAALASEAGMLKVFLLNVAATATIAFFCCDDIIFFHKHCITAAGPIALVGRLNIITLHGKKEDVHVVCAGNDMIHFIKK